MHFLFKGQLCCSRSETDFSQLFTSSYIGTSYLLASTVFLPFFASIADIYGRHFGLQLSLLFFLIGSAISTGAMNMPMILAGRGIAGIGAAGLLTVRLLSLYSYLPSGVFHSCTHFPHVIAYRSFELSCRTRYRSIRTISSNRCSFSSIPSVLALGPLLAGFWLRPTFVGYSPSSEGFTGG